MTKRHNIPRPLFAVKLFICLNCLNSLILDIFPITCTNAFKYLNFEGVKLDINNRISTKKGYFSDLNKNSFQKNSLKIAFYCL